MCVEALVPPQWPQSKKMEAFKYVMNMTNFQNPDPYKQTWE